MTHEHSSQPARQEESPFFSGRSSASVTLLLLSLASLVVRVIVAHRNVYPSYDGTFYLNTARDLIALGRLYPSGFPPGYPFLAALPLYGLGWSSPAAPLIAGQIVNVTAGIVLGLLSYRLARRSLSPLLALIVAGIMLFLPLSLQLSASDLSDLSFACFLLGGWLLYASHRMGLAGLVWGYSYLIKPEGLIVVALVGAVALLRRRPRSWRLWAAACIPVVPYALYATIAAGAPTVSEKWIFLERTVHAHPGFSLLGHYAANALDLGGMFVHALGPLVALLLLAGLFVKPGLWILCCIPIFLLPVFDFRMEARYWIPYLPFALLAAAQGFEWITRRLTMLRFQRALKGALALSTLATLLLAGYGQRALLRGNFEYYPAMREAGIWLRERVTRDTIIAGRKPYVSYWAWCQYRRIPATEQLEELTEWAEEQECDFLVVHVGVALGMAPQLIPLIGGAPPALRDRLELLRSFVIPGQPNETTFLYRILRAPNPEASAVGGTGR